jgi:hypothetical protein
MIHRLGLSHALGNQKRFVVATERRQYQSGERVVAKVEAYDQNYEPLNPAKLQPPLAQLSGELLLPAATGCCLPRNGSKPVPSKSPASIRVPICCQRVSRRRFRVTIPAERARGSRRGRQPVEANGVAGRS